MFEYDETPDYDWAAEIDDFWGWMLEYPHLVEKLTTIEDIDYYYSLWTGMDPDFADEVIKYIGSLPTGVIVKEAKDFLGDLHLSEYEKLSKNFKEVNTEFETPYVYIPLQTMTYDENELTITQLEFEESYPCECEETPADPRMAEWERKYSV